MKSIQHDNVSIPGRTLARLAGTLKASDPELAGHLAALARWDGELSLKSPEGPLYGFWLQELLDAFYKPHVPASQLEFVRSRQGVANLMQALEKPDPFWFGKDPVAGRDLLLRSTLAAAIPKAKAALGNDPKQWTWGKLHVAPFRHPLAQLGPEHEKAFNLGPVARPGDGHTPHAASHNPKFEQISGASYRHIFDLADWDRGLATSVPGQSAQPGSPYYGDLLPLWAGGEYFPLVYSRKKVEEVTKHRLVLKPK